MVEGEPRRDGQCARESASVLPFQLLPVRSACNHFRPGVTLVPSASVRVTVAAEDTPLARSR